MIIENPILDLKNFIVKIMETEHEIDSPLPERPKELPEQLPEVISPAIEMPDITPVVKTTEITDGMLHSYTKSLNSLVAKYAKSTGEKK